MSAANIQSKKFLEAMMLPKNQRREVLERLGASLMEQLKVEDCKAKQQAIAAK